MSSHKWRIDKGSGGWKLSCERCKLLQSYGMTYQQAKKQLRLWQGVVSGKRYKGEASKSS